MKKRLLMSVLCLAMAGCAVVAPDAAPPGDGAAAGESGEMRPVARPATLDTTARPVPAAARTVEEFDTTTAEERSAAAAETAGAERALGRTVASLGSPTEPGFWLKTPLVSSPSKGRVVYPGSGKSVAVNLIPIDGPDTAGSRMSLPAMRLIDAPLTGLPEVQVFQVGG